MWMNVVSFWQQKSQDTLDVDSNVLITPKVQIQDHVQSAVHFSGDIHSHPLAQSVQQLGYLASLTLFPELCI